VPDQTAQTVTEPPILLDVLLLDDVPVLLLLLPQATTATPAVASRATSGRRPGMGTPSNVGRGGRLRGAHAETKLRNGLRESMIGRTQISGNCTYHVMHHRPPRGRRRRPG